MSGCTECIRVTHRVKVTCLFKTLFSGPDYAVFSCMLIVSALVGIYFAYQSRRKTENVNDYLMAGRSMHFFPTSLSIMCTALSAITILGRFFERKTE